MPLAITFAPYQIAKLIRNVSIKARSRSVTFIWSVYWQRLQMYRWISLDGGDLGAVSQLLILDEFMRRLEWDTKSETRILPCEYFHMMAGVGTGGYALYLYCLYCSLPSTQNHSNSSLNLTNERWRSHRRVYIHLASCLCRWFSRPGNALGEARGNIACFVEAERFGETKLTRWEWRLRQLQNARSTPHIARSLTLTDS